LPVQPGLLALRTSTLGPVLFSGFRFWVVAREGFDLGALFMPKA